LMGLPNVLMTAMLSDIGEYVHWKSDVKAEGVIFSTRTFGTKLSAGLFAFVVSLTLTLVNYVPNVEQTIEAKNVIFMIVSFLHLILSIDCLFLLFIIYYIDIYKL